MGYLKLTYEEYMHNIDFWEAKNIILPAWAERLANFSRLQGINAVDFYEDIFGDDLEEHRQKDNYIIGEYAGLVQELSTYNSSKTGKEKTYVRTTVVTQGNGELYKLIDKSENFCFMSAVSYAGKNRKREYARYLYALVIEIDDIEPTIGIDELLYSWEGWLPPARMPKPTYLVCSGSGVHLYYVFNQPIPLYKEIYKQLSAAKNNLTKRFWNRKITNSYQDDKIQYESIIQPFRCVGTITKTNNMYTMAFRVGDKISIEYLNEYLPKEKKIKGVFESRLRLNDAKALYPEWYQKRIVEKKAKGHWNKHPKLYLNFIEKIKMGAVDGTRYHCLEALCALGVQCNIPREQVLMDCAELAEYFETLTVKPNNHFTEHDLLCALDTYNKGGQKAYERKIEVISQKTGIPIERTPRRKRPLKRDDGTAFAAARDVLNRQYPNGEWRNKDGAPKKIMIVKEWRKSHPNGTKADCSRDTKMDPKTIRKWWDYEEEQNE